MMRLFFRNHQISSHECSIVHEVIKALLRGLDFIMNADRSAKPGNITLKVKECQCVVKVMSSGLSKRIYNLWHWQIRPIMIYRYLLRRGVLF